MNALNFTATHSLSARLGRAALAPIVFAFAVALAGCTGAADKPAANIVDSAGVAIVRGPAADDSLPWTFTKVVEIGGADTGAQAFTNPNPYTVATDGASRIAVLDSRGQQVQLLDTTGAHVRTLGGMGGGPGEMKIPMGIVMEASGRVSVLDLAKSAVVRWDPNGTVLNELHVAPGSGHVWGMVQPAGDTVLAAVEVLDSTRAIRRLERWTPQDSTVLDSTVGKRPEMVRFKCVGIALSPLFTGELSFATNGERTAITHQTEYAVDVYERGKLVQRVRRAIAPVPATAADAQKLYPEGFKVRFGGGGECVTPALEVGEKVGVAPTLPLVRRVVLAPDGALWVERYTFDGEVARTDVFDARGAYLGTVIGKSAPLGFLGTDRALFAITNDDDGTSTVGVFRIRR